LFLIGKIAIYSGGAPEKNFEILRTGQKKNIGNNQFDQGSTFFIGAQALTGLPLLSRCVILYG